MNELVEDLVDYIERFMVLSKDQLLVVAIWIIHTYCLDAIEETPYLSVTSPDPECGKTRLLRILEVLVDDAWVTILPSEAVLYREIDNRQPTLLLDEIDTIFSPKTADKYEPIRALLNAGNRRGATIPRCIGTTGNVHFSTFCAKAIAGIGVLPDTVASRSIPIRLQRKRKEQVVEHFLLRIVKGEADPLVERIVAFRDQHLEDIEGKFPKMPEELSDRMVEATESLARIADLLNCGREFRQSLVALLSGERPDRAETMRHRLLRDLRYVYDQHLGAASGLHSNKIVMYLRAIEESPWKTYYGRSFNQKDLADLLGHYEVRSKNVRVADATPAVAKGYAADDLFPIWDRYLQQDDGPEEA